MVNRCRAYKMAFFEADRHPDIAYDQEWRRRKYNMENRPRCRKSKNTENTFMNFPVTLPYSVGTESLIAKQKWNQRD
jgi:hypothetical protein